jgi:N-acetylglucosamine kinase-like BadF-type ATPase
MPVFLGVDGGGTKTAFVLVTDSGRILGRSQGASTYHLEHGLTQVQQVLVDGVAAVTQQAAISADAIDFAFVALPTYGESSRDIAAFDALPALALGHTRYRCGNDTVAGWAGSLATEDGINVVAGTGSITYGQRDGASARAGGWGELFGDEGSGYWIGLQALTAFSRMSDGRAARTLLHARIRELLQLDTDLDLIDVVLEQWQSSRGRIATLSPVVVEAARDGDPVSAGILDAAAAHLVDLVEATRDRLGFPPDDTVPVSYSGGVFRADSVRDRFVNGLSLRSAVYDIRRPRLPSDIGAALYAALLAGRPLTRPALDALTRTAGSDGLGSAT